MHTGYRSGETTPVTEVYVDVDSFGVSVEVRQGKSGNLIDHPFDVAPVSYTHLDVYKRQSHRSAADAFAAEAKSGEGLEIDVRQANVANPADCESIVNSVIRDYGRLDILVNNAGIVRDRSALKMQLLDFDQVMKTNLYGPFFMAKACLLYTSRCV